MADLAITRSYSNGATLTEAQLDAAKNSITTYVNVTKLTGSGNIKAAGIRSQNLANSVATTTTLATDSITTNKLGAAVVSATKLAALNIQTSANTTTTNS